MQMRVIIVDEQRLLRAIVTVCSLIAAQYEFVIIEYKVAKYQYSTRLFHIYVSALQYNKKNFVYFIFMSQIVLYFLHSASLLSFYMDVFLILSIRVVNDDVRRKFIRLFVNAFEPNVAVLKQSNTSSHGNDNGWISVWTTKINYRCGISLLIINHLPKKYYLCIYPQHTY